MEEAQLIVEALDRVWVSICIAAGPLWWMGLKK